MITVPQPKYTQLKMNHNGADFFRTTTPSLTERDCFHITPSTLTDKGTHLWQFIFFKFRFHFKSVLDSEGSSTINVRSWCSWIFLSNHYEAIVQRLQREEITRAKDSES